MKGYLLLTGILGLMSMQPTFGAVLTGHEGGGGDPQEERVNVIREDLLKWINAGGAKEMEFKTVSYGEYESRMKEILQPKKVVVGFVEKDSTTNDELKVSVKGVPKTCRGFIGKKDQLPHILCNISRFNATSESLQYRLIHHEYAGLVNLEKNEGAASDYELSSQITDYLQATTVLKLAVKKKLESAKPSADKAEATCNAWKEGVELKVQERTLKSVESSAIRMINTLYKVNNLSPIKRIQSLGLVKEIFGNGAYSSLLTEKYLTYRYRVEAGDDSIDLNVVLKIYAYKLEVVNKELVRRDSLGRVLDSGVSCTILKNRYNVTSYSNMIEVTLSNSENDTILNSETSNYYLQQDVGTTFVKY